MAKRNTENLKELAGMHAVEKLNCTEYRVALLCASAPGEISSQEIQGRLGLKRSNASIAFNGLRRRGILIRTVHDGLYWYHTNYSWTPENGLPKNQYSFEDVFDI